MAKSEAAWTEKTWPKQRQEAGPQDRQEDGRSASCTTASCTSRPRSTTRIVTITDPDGNVICLVERRLARASTARARARRSPRSRRPLTPANAARNTACDGGGAGEGPGLGPRVGHPRAATAGLEVRSIKDVTPIPHNGCRRPRSAGLIRFSSASQRQTPGCTSKGLEWHDTSVRSAGCAAARA